MTPKDLAAKLQGLEIALLRDRAEKAEAKVERLRAGLQEIVERGCDLEPDPPFTLCPAALVRDEWCDPCIARSLLEGGEHE